MQIFYSLNILPERYMRKTRLDTRRNRLCILHCKRSPKHDKVTFEHTYFDNSIGMIMSKVSGKGTTFMYAHGIHSRAKLSLAIKLHSYNKYSSEMKMQLSHSPYLYFSSRWICLYKHFCFTT